ncbi:hypothetical protein L1049_001051 [Liquidambar formosana]|uniref:Amino acid transporter transmembrane domain-containing protein n=1 Tax=Liquidambar formosana TaxID=63359 RepID=A0AAP0R846_LIQFO
MAVENFEPANASCDDDGRPMRTGNGRIKGSIGGMPATSTAHKLYSSFQALGDIAFAYPYSIILLEIQDTLKSTPPENKIMKKASVTAVSFTTFFYLGCGCFGYAAFGNHTPGNILSGFGFYEPYWLVDFANACIILHLVGGYQMSAMISNVHIFSSCPLQPKVIGCRGTEPTLEP